MIHIWYVGRATKGLLGPSQSSVRWYLLNSIIRMCEIDKSANLSGDATMIEIVPMGPHQDSPQSNSRVNPHKEVQQAPFVRAYASWDESHVVAERAFMPKDAQCAVAQAKTGRCCGRPGAKLHQLLCPVSLPSCGWRKPESSHITRMKD